MYARSIRRRADASSCSSPVGRSAPVEADLALDVKCELGEGPVWDPIARCLYFVDIMAGRVHRFDPAANADRVYDIAADVVSIGSLGLTNRDDLVLAVRDG